ncbi:ATPase [Nonlabens tegetincola]|uniref:ATPase n=1 Tax=Nonlabens tegetincola TaxID=323273 RepID=UPI000A203C20|nr:ATPase [Nonlabens tegetincola]ARN70631.1 ATPase [Nonlabens tegetincola]
MKNQITEFAPNNPGTLILGGTQFQVAELKNNFLHYDFKSALRFLDARGKLLFGKQFKIYDEDKALLYKLINYFIGDQNECDKFDLDLNKGLLLSGPVGCGKTTLMRLLPHLVPHKRYHQFALIPCRNIVFGFNHLGYKTIEDYSDNKPYCFDDLGVEATGRHYGKDCNVMGEILISRYEVFKQKDILTHITTNLNAVEIEERYGERVRSRMREQFNLISFSAKSKDKRI